MADSFSMYSVHSLPLLYTLYSCSWFIDCQSCPLGTLFFFESLADANADQTIFLCVWQAIHLNIPPPGEPRYKQILRRTGWSMLAIIAPEVVALNAWLQYRSARDLMGQVNECRRLDPTEVDQAWSKWLKGHLLRLGSRVGMLCISPIRLADYLRMVISRRSDHRRFQSEQRRAINDDILSQLDSDRLPWTMATAYYAFCGGAVLVSDYGMGETLSPEAIVWLAEHQPRSLIPLQKAVLQDPSKASGLAKIITCTQALWFCSQCVARLSQDMAISLLELNTFAHCVSALCIYAFWWHKPYDVETHVYMNNLSLYQRYLLYGAVDSMDVKALEFDVKERTPTGEFVILSRNPRFRPSNSYYSRKPHLHMIEELEIIPGTGFVLSDTKILSGPPIFMVSDTSWIYWKELWDVRVACNHSDTPELLSHDRNFANVCLPRARNFNSEFIDSLGTEDGFVVPLVMILTFLVYGSIHLLAWQYHFPTHAESIMWRSASVATASSGLLVLCMNAPDSIIEIANDTFEDLGDRILAYLVILLASVAVIARSFLFIESFRALPNSPASTYEVPSWTAYVPHI